MKGKISSAFSVPLYQAEIQDPTRLNNELLHLLQVKAQLPEYKNPRPYTVRNEALFESRFDMFSWPEKPIQALNQFCCQHVYQCVAELNKYDAAYLSTLKLGVDSWFHMTKSGGYFSIHNHPMASWSGVYCVHAGEPDAAVPNNGHLSFISPFIQSSMFVDAGNAQMIQPYQLGNLGFQLKAGQLIIFPSWLLHEVKPFYGSQKRVTVAFNCWFYT